MGLASIGRLLQAFSVDRGLVKNDGLGPARNPFRLPAEQPGQLGLERGPVLFQHQQLIDHSGNFQVGCQDLLLDALPQGITGFADPHEVFQDLLVAPGHLLGAVGVGKLVVSGLHLPRDAVGHLRNVDGGGVGLLFSHAAHQAALARKRHLLGYGDLLHRHVLIRKTEVGREVHYPEAQHGVVQGAGLGHLLSDRRRFLPGGQDFRVVLEGLLDHSVDVQGRLGRRRERGRPDQDRNQKGEAC